MENIGISPKKPYQLSSTSEELFEFCQKVGF